MIIIIYVVYVFWQFFKHLINQRRTEDLVLLNILKILLLLSMTEFFMKTFPWLKAVKDDLQSPTYTFGHYMYFRTLNPF